MPKPLLHNGKPINLRRPEPAIDKIVNFLNRSESLGTFDYQALIGQINVGHCTLTRFVKDERFSQYSYRWGTKRQVAIGHPKCVAEFKRYLDQMVGQ